MSAYLFIRLQAHRDKSEPISFHNTWCREFNEEFGDAPSRSVGIDRLPSSGYEGGS